MSVATESNGTTRPPANTAMPAVPAQRQAATSPGAVAAVSPAVRPWQEATVSPSADLGGAVAVEQAISAAIADASRISEIFAALRTARLWLPLPEDGEAVTSDGAVRLPTVIYLGSEFVPAYTSAGLLAASARPDSRADGAIPHAVTRATDLAGLLPPDIGIALNAGAGQSVPIYPQGVTILASEPGTTGHGRVTMGPLPCRPAGLLAGISAGLAGIPQAGQAAAGWLSIQSAGEGMIISVTLDEPTDPATQDAIIRAVTRAADAAGPEVQWPLDVTFPGEGEPDYIDRWFAAFAEPFYRRS
jgi:hypothetical protein